MIAEINGVMQISTSEFVLEFGGSDLPYLPVSVVGALGAALALLLAERLFVDQVLFLD